MISFEFEKGLLSNFIKITREAIDVTEKSTLFENLISHPFMKIMKEVGCKTEETFNRFTLTDVRTALLQTKNYGEGLRLNKSILGRPLQHTGRLRNYEIDDFRKTQNYAASGELV